MAAAALKSAKQKGEKMGLPCEKNTDDQINHESKGATQDSEPQKMESEMQMSGKWPKNNSGSFILVSSNMFLIFYFSVQCLFYFKIQFFYAFI